MGNFLANIRYVAWTALILGALLLIVMWTQVAMVPPDALLFWDPVFRWLHVLSGIMWIGHLYYFNFTQIPNAPKIPEEHRGPAIAKVIAPAALYWFRWGAVATLVTGICLAGVNGYVVDALTLGAQSGFASGKNIFIGIGEANAKLEASVKAKAARTAMLFSRTNTLLSAPMLVAMTSAQAFAG